MQRLPKLPGFRSLRVKSEIVYTDQLESLKEKNITNKLLAEKGLTTSEFVVVKLLHRGDLTKSVNLSIQGASLGAMESVQKAGGSVDLVSRIGRPQKDNQRSAKA
jgi:ribosomal protein L15